MNRLAIRWYLRQGLLPPADLSESASFWQQIQMELIRDKFHRNRRGRRRLPMTDDRIRELQAREWRKRTQENGRRYRASRRGYRPSEHSAFFAEIQTHL